MESCTLKRLTQLWGKPQDSIMDNRLITYLTFAVVAVMAFLLLANVFPIFIKPIAEKYIGYNDVRGMAVEYEGKLYTLNFDQQKNAIGFFNQSIASTSKPSQQADFSKLIIYRFNQLTDIVIKPEGYDNNQNLIFTAPEWTHEGSLQDVSQGKFKALIHQIYTE